MYIFVFYPPDPLTHSLLHAPLNSAIVNAWKFSCFLLPILQQLSWLYFSLAKIKLQQKFNISCYYLNIYRPSNSVLRGPRSTVTFPYMFQLFCYCTYPEFRFAQILEEVFGGSRLSSGLTWQTCHLSGLGREMKKYHKLIKIKSHL